MSQIVPPIKPFVTDNGVQLYDTDDFRGMSHSGLGRFCGVAESKIRQLLDSIDRLSVQSELLKPLSGKVLAVALPLSTGGTVSVIPAEICAAICTYYATESKAANDTARYSLAKFAAMGIDSWIRNVTGHAIAPAIDPAQAALQLAMQLIEVQRELNLSQARLIESSEAKQVRDSFIQQGEGLKMMFDEFENEPDDLNEYPCPDKVNGVPRKYSIKEYLSFVQEVDLSTIDRGTMSGYGRKVADTFKTHQIAPPEERIGKKGGVHKVYSKADFPLLATAWESYRRERALENIKKLG
jgi:hypothetical protein